VRLVDVATPRDTLAGGFVERVVGPSRKTVSMWFLDRVTDSWKVTTIKEFSCGPARRETEER